MDAIQKALIKAGRKDLAQAYYKMIKADESQQAVKDKDLHDIADIFTNFLFGGIDTRKETVRKLGTYINKPLTAYDTEVMPSGSESVPAGHVNDVLYKLFKSYSKI
jgi:hypothetical protein